MVPRPLLDRRAFMGAAGAGFLAALGPRAALALARTDAVFASAFRAPDGSFGVATMTERGEIVDKARLPDRAHGMAACGATGRVVAFARRPGTFAVIFDKDAACEPLVIATPEGRHFFGHGEFSTDGRILFASENDFEAGRGVIGLYDATSAFRRIGEFDAHGIGTHDIGVSPDGRFLAIANGGIETHPDFGRTKLNLDRMQPSLVLLDARSGALVQRHVLPPALAQLSTRHLAFGERGRIWFACQFEGSRNETPPLAGYFSSGGDPIFVTLPADVTERMGHYVGAIAVNRNDGLVGLSSPRGGLVLLDARDGRFVSERAVRDAAGVAASAVGIAVASYDGTLAETKSPVNWDQHLLRIQS